MAGCVGVDLQAMRTIEIADSLQKGKKKMEHRIEEEQLMKRLEELAKIEGERGGDTAKVATHEELCDQALKHYEDIANVASHWSSLVPEAIRYYRDNYKGD